MQIQFTLSRQNRLTPPGIPLTIRFWDNINKTNDCWLWIGYRNKKGYGVITKSRRDGNMLVHRLSWELHFGPIPLAMEVCHHCDNPPCVRPGHLFLGTQADNVHDMIKKGRERLRVHIGEAHYCAKLSASEVIEIRQSYNNGQGISSLAKTFRVSRGAIWYIVTGRHWKHLLPAYSIS